MTDAQVKQPVSRSVKVFDKPELERAGYHLEEMEPRAAVAGNGLLNRAKDNNGFRIVPEVQPAIDSLEYAKYRFENLVEPINQLQLSLALVGAMAPSEFRIAPILLLGDPGIGKTYLAMQLAKVLRVPMEKLSAGGAQGGFQLTGSNSQFNRAAPGMVCEALSQGNSACPVFVIDEVDKIRDAQYPVTPALLDLMEPVTARSFKDEFLEMTFDASRIIFVLTANTLDGIPSSLLSRVEVFDIPRPDYAQRLRIVESEAEKLRHKTGRHIVLDEVSIIALAERTEIDLRRTTRMVHDAFARALARDSRWAEIDVSKVVRRRRGIGFLV